LTQSSSTRPGTRANSPPIICHQNRAGGNGVPGNRRVDRADRRPGETQRHLNIGGRIHRSAVPGQDGIEAGREGVSQMLRGGTGLLCGL